MQEEINTMRVVGVTIGGPIGAGYGNIGCESLTPERSAFVKDKLVEHRAETSLNLPLCCIDGRSSAGTMAGEPAG